MCSSWPSGPCLAWRSKPPMSPGWCRRGATSRPAPALIALLDVGVIDDSLYIVTEYLAGRDLHEIVLRSEEKQRALSLPLLLHISRELSAGLGQLHRVTGSGRLPPTLEPTAHSSPKTCCAAGRARSSWRIATLWAVLFGRLAHALEHAGAPARPVASAAAPTRADDLAGLSAIVSGSGRWRDHGAVVFAPFVAAAGDGWQGSAPPWVAPLSADDSARRSAASLPCCPAGCTNRRLRRPRSCTT